MKPQIGKRYLLSYWEDGVHHYDIVFYTNFLSSGPRWEFERNKGTFPIKEDDEIIPLGDIKFEKIST